MRVDISTMTNDSQKLTNEAVNLEGVLETAIAEYQTAHDAWDEAWQEWFDNHSEIADPPPGGGRWNDAKRLIAARTAFPGIYERKQAAKLEIERIARAQRINQLHIRNLERQISILNLKQYYEVETHEA